MYSKNPNTLLSGDPGRIRTYDARLRTAALYPLSYRAFAIYSNSLGVFWLQ
jgi:hypothetical protein